MVCKLSYIINPQREGYSSHFDCLSVRLSVADLEDGGLLALQRGVNLNWMTIYIPLICHFFEIRPCS